MNNRSKLPGTHCTATKPQISSICFCLLKLHYCTVEHLCTATLSFCLICFLSPLHNCRKQSEICFAPTRVFCLLLSSYTIVLNPNGTPQTYMFKIS
ncbi:hypothetical protein Peur_049643 [Populus x canadensis]